MPTAAQVLAIDRIPNLASKCCSICRRPKPMGDFALDPRKPDCRDSRCKRCMRLRYNTYYHEGGGKEEKAAYNARPEVMERQRQYNAARTADQRRASELAYLATLRGRLIKGRCRDRGRLRRATDLERRATIEARLVFYDREIARLDRDYAAPRAEATP